MAAGSARDAARMTDSTFAPPPLEVTVADLRALFHRSPPDPAQLLPNLHHEDPVAPERHRDAKPAAVLIGCVDDDAPRLLLTRRHESISAPRQICFPGGTRDFGDADAIATALRETHEEVGLPATSVEPLGILGRYYSHSGHAIEPVVAVVRPPFDLRPRPQEVAEILYLPFADAFRPDAYRLVQHDPDHPRAHWFVSDGQASITGPTVCLLMHLYEALAAYLGSTAGRTS